MDKVKKIIGNLLAEFSVGFPGEYLPTGIAGLFFGVLAAFGLNGGGRDQEKLAFWFFAVIGGLLVLRSVFKTLRNKGHASKQLYALLVHVLMFVLLDLLAQFLVPMVIILVVLAVIVVFLGGGSIGSALDEVAAQREAQRRAEEQAKEEKKVEVWRMNGMTRENLKVNSTQDMYFDPEDGEWHKIK